MIHTALHARCVIVVPSATMRVPNYADSGIKHDSKLLKAVLRLTRDLFALFVQRWVNLSTDTERRAGSRR